MPGQTITTIILISILLLNFYTLSTSVDNLKLSNELSQNATDRAMRVSQLKTASLTDYAWHFNTGQKLDMMQDDIDEIKNELGLVKNLTYASPLTIYNNKSK